MKFFLAFFSFGSACFGQVDFISDIQPLFNRRCIQCHSCYNSPCQLNLTSASGLERGLIQGHLVYDSKRLRKEKMSRLGIDGKTVQDWRNFGFRSVIKPKSNFIAELIEHKRNNAKLPVDDLINFDSEQAENSRECPDSPSELRRHLKDRPNAGMPYGLPSLNDAEAELIRQWSQDGAPVSRVQLKNTDRRMKKQFTTFMNRYTSEKDIERAKKQSLVSRYIFEHLFLAHINLGSGIFYRLVRSRSQCKSGIDEIATRRPWDDTASKFYYCLAPVSSALVHKTHIVYPIDSRKIKRWKKQFFATNWSVSFSQGFVRWAIGTSGWSSDLAPRKDAKANNPFLIFKDIPVSARYQFLLDDAKYFIQTFIRGPVCKGNTAVNSIDEQFYVFFIKPDSDLMVMSDDFNADSIDLLHLPAQKGSEQTGFIRSLRFGKQLRKDRNQFRVLRDRYYGKLIPKGYKINDLWRGNDNAALTVMRHFNSASVVKGLVGATSKTIFVLDYSILQRLVYDLVAGFDVYGDVNHQLHTRIYMAYLRMEAEENFLSFLPAQARKPMRHFWYTEGDSKTEKIATSINALLRRGRDKIDRRFPLLGTSRSSSIGYRPFQSSQFYRSSVENQFVSLRSLRQQFVVKVESHLGAVQKRQPRLNSQKSLRQKTKGMKIGRIRSISAFEKQVDRVTDIRAINGPWVTKLPSVSMVMIGNEIYTFIRNKEHFNVAWISGENGRRNWANDSLTVYKGVAGSYPNQIFNVPLNKARQFLQEMIAISDFRSYSKWVTNFGSPRHGKGSERFWKNSDKLHRLFKRKYPVEYGAFDYNRMGVDYRFNKDGNSADQFFSKLPKKLRTGAGSLVEGN